MKRRSQSIRQLVLARLMEAKGLPLKSEAIAQDIAQACGGETRIENIRTAVHRLRDDGLTVLATGRGYILKQQSTH